MRTEGFTVWLTGLQGTGKRSISDELARMLLARHLAVEQLDIRTPGLDTFRSADPTQPAADERRCCWGGSHWTMCTCRSTPHYPSSSLWPGMAYRNSDRSDTWPLADCCHKAGPHSALSGG